MIAGPLVVAGDALLDRDLSGTVARLCPDAPVPVVEDPCERSRPGGAGLAALLAARDGHDVVLVTALAEDEAGRRLRSLFEDAGIELLTTTYTGQTPQKVRIRAAGHPLLRLDYGCALGSVGDCTPAMRKIVAQAGAVLVADYGRGVAASAGLRSAIAARARSAPVVWDPHPRGPAPVAGVRLATPNLAEAQLFAPEIPAAAGLRVATAGAAVRAEWLRGHWSAGAVAVTLGGGGALLAREGRPALHIPATPARGDTCGAGDRFASAAAGALLGGAPLAAAVSEAVAAASRYVAADGPAGLEPQPIAAVEAR